MLYFECGGKRYYAGQEGAISRHETRLMLPMPQDPGGQLTEAIGDCRRSITTVVATNTPQDPARIHNRALKVWERGICVEL